MKIVSAIIIILFTVGVFALLNASSKADDHAESKKADNADRCVSCGEIIPEGRQVCPNCERSVTDGKEKEDG